MQCFYIHLQVKSPFHNVSAQSVLKSKTFYLKLKIWVPSPKFAYFTQCSKLFFCISLFSRGMIYDGNETYYVQPFPGDMNRVSGIYYNI